MVVMPRMKKLLKGEINMKKQAMRIFAVLSFLFTLTVGSAYAQIASPAKANIPFDFHVGKKVLPAGEYKVGKPHNQQSTVAVYGMKGQGSAVSLAGSIQTGKAPQTTKLVFRRYGDQYFLAQIFFVGNTTGVEMSRTKAERKVSKEYRDRNLANQNVEPELVTVVAAGQ